MSERLPSSWRHDRSSRSLRAGGEEGMRRADPIRAPGKQPTPRLTRRGSIRWPLVPAPHRGGSGKGDEARRPVARRPACRSLFGGSSLDGRGGSVGAGRRNARARCRPFPCPIGRPLLAAQHWKGTMLRTLTLIATTLGSALAAAPALAHHPMGGATPSTLAQGLLSGIGHPIVGLDHLAFVIAVGIAAALLGSRFLLPLAFIGATILGTLVHLAAVGLPAVEAVIAAFGRARRPAALPGPAPAARCLRGPVRRRRPVPRPRLRRGGVRRGDDARARVSRGLRHDPIRRRPCWPAGLWFTARAASRPTCRRAWPAAWSPVRVCCWWASGPSPRRLAKALVLGGARSGKSAFAEAWVMARAGGMPPPLPRHGPGLGRRDAGAHLASPRRPGARRGRRSRSPSSLPPRSAKRRAPCWSTA